MTKPTHGSTRPPPRGSMYTRQVWRCPACGREGQVLVHRLDTTGTMEYRRQQSHAAQVRADHCAGDRLEWVTDR